MCCMLITYDISICHIRMQNHCRVRIQPFCKPNYMLANILIYSSKTFVSLDNFFANNLQMDYSILIYYDFNKLIIFGQKGYFYPC